MRKTWTTAAAAVVAVTLAQAAQAQLAFPDHNDIGQMHAQAEVKPAPESPAEEPRALIGREVFAKDQTRVGDVQKVVGNPDGTVIEIHIKTGGFLGFGGKMVSIHQDQFSMRGMYVQLQLTSDEVSRLPEVKNGM
ncbi:MAG: PRC-barrel domain-containing protein [Hyphomicrobiaceae bacterium]|nr:PRC-barrel domain-containing protein [Hyphomicrobiaceae bacterium]